MRERYEYTKHPAFGADPQDRHGVWLQRFALHGDWQWPQGWRAFAELHGAHENGRAGGPGPTDENQLELQNAFLEAPFPAAPGVEARLRVGRQEMQFGSARLVSVRDGPNVRRTFDGVRLLVRSDVWLVDAIAARPRDDQPGAFDDSTDDSRALWGLYATRWMGADDERGLDVYYLGYQNDDAVFDQGRASERRHTLGVRFFGSRGSWDWNVEPMVQFGRFGGDELRAWTIASETAYTWSEIAWRPRVVLSANIASGDRNSADPDLETFNPLFPRGNYFSEDATLGPQNFFNAHVFLTLRPTDTWALTADYDLFWRLSTDDAIYGPSGAVLRPSGTGDERFVATAFSFNSEWSVNRKLSFTAIYAYLTPQAFIRDSEPAKPVRFLELTARYRF